jgi:tyrosine-protein kinase Etk/Wzc
MDNGSGDLIVALKKAPQKGVEYAYLMRDVKVQESLYKFVIQLFEQAKFTEANTIPSVQVLEWAKIPQKKTRPKRSIICIMIFFVGLVGNTLYILSREWLAVQKAQNTELYQKLLQIRHLMAIRK